MASVLGVKKPRGALVGVMGRRAPHSLEGSDNGTAGDTRPPCEGGNARKLPGLRLGALGHCMT